MAPNSMSMKPKSGLGGSTKRSKLELDFQLERLNQCLVIYFGTPTRFLFSELEAIETFEKYFRCCDL